MKLEVLIERVAERLPSSWPRWLVLGITPALVIALLLALNAVSASAAEYVAG